MVEREKIVGLVDEKAEVADENKDVGGEVRIREGEKEELRKDMKESRGSWRRRVRGWNE